MHVHAGQGSLAAYRVDRLTYQAAPRRAASWPHQIGVIPRRAGSFQDRGEVQGLRGTAVLCQVLTGMGGVGKTQLAADYAHTAWEHDDLDVLVWVSASSRSAIESAYAHAAEELCGVDPTVPEKAAEQFLAWLQPKAGAATCRWLIVLDDIADPGDLCNLWPPASPHGRTLATTRRRDAALSDDGRRLVPVGLFTPDKAVAYLNSSLVAHGRHESTEQLAGLAAELGHLPLALSQAAAYLIDAGLEIAAYRQLLAEQMRHLADLLPESGAALPDNQPLGVAAVWSLSIDRADELRPEGLAWPMLQLAAMLDPNGIPQAVLTSPPALAYLTDGRATQVPPGTTVSEEQAIGTLRALHRLSLIDHNPNTPYHAVRVHQLIQRTVRDRLSAGQRHAFTGTAADSLIAAWPDIERDSNLSQALRANTDALASHAQNALWAGDGYEVLFRMVQSLGQSGQAAAAAHHSQLVADSAGRLLGPDHPDTLRARGGVVMWQGMAGDAAGAAAAFAELLPELVRVLGPDHPDTLTARRNVAFCWGMAGDAAGAAAALAELAAEHERVLGPDHPESLGARSDLARWRGVAGDAAGAAAAFAELLPELVRVLGPDDPVTLGARNNLADCRGVAGDAAGAVAAFAELLPELVRIFGPDHPDTLIVRRNLDLWRGRACWNVSSLSRSLHRYLQGMNENDRS